MATLMQCADEVSAEALVAIFRDAREIGNVELADEALTRILGWPQPEGVVAGGFCEGAIRKAAYSCGIRDPHTLEDFRSDCYERVLHALSAERPKKRLWEANFRVALFGAVAEIRRKHRRTSARERDIVAIEEELAHRLISSEVEIEVTMDARRTLEIISELGPEYYRAAYLRWCEDLPVESGDPDKLTIAGALRVSGRTVRNHLRRSREHVRSRVAGKVASQSEM